MSDTSATTKTQAIWETLDPDRQSRLFALMRDYGEASDRYFAKGRISGGMVEVGPALFDDTLKGAVRYELVSALRTATSVDEAVEKASEKVREWVRAHNARRPRDAHWRRWTEAGQDDLQACARCVREAVL